MYRLLLLLLVLTSITAAQDDLPSVISADTVRDLRHARTVRYADVAETPYAPDALPLSGWFTLSPDGSKAAFVIDGGIRIMHTGGDSTHDTGWTVDDGTVIDARWNVDSSELAVVYQRPERPYLVTVGMDDAKLMRDLPDDLGIPVRVWFGDDSYLWLETTPAPDDPDRSGFQVVRLPLYDAADDEPLSLPTGPEHDFDSFVRIGRIPAPLAITATFNGTVRRWDLQTGDITAEVELPVAPTFGRVNETNGVEFAWRDEASTALHLLNFDTGEDVELAPLHGEYIQALLLTPDASVVLAVHRGDDATVTAWITATGEEIALGAYGDGICSRVPDMVQLAQNGTRLVIGCDSGFEVWEVER